MRFSLLVAPLDQERHRFGCIWSFVTYERIDRASTNLWTTLRDVLELWIPASEEISRTHG